jgi:hypothetical protein
MGYLLLGVDAAQRMKSERKREPSLEQPATTDGGCYASIISASVVDARSVP